MIQISKSTEETERLAKEITKDLKEGGIACFFGDLGTGKTTLIKGIAGELGVKKFRVKSPTYTYIREYKRDDSSIFHVDLYRLEEIDDLLWEEIEEIFSKKKNIVLIEWADRMEDYLPEKRINIFLKYIDKDEREIIIEND